jgi:hypothetical protein
MSIPEPVANVNATCSCVTPAVFRASAKACSAALVGSNAKRFCPRYYLAVFEDNNLYGLNSHINADCNHPRYL